MACMTRGSPVTSPILPGVIEDRLPPLTDYTSPEDRSGMTDIWVQDHQARTRRVAVWLHRLDMALRISGKGPTQPRAPVGLLPGPWNCLGPTVRGRNQPGPQGKSEAQ